MKLIRWFIGIFGGVLVGLWIALAVLSRAPVLQQALIRALNDNMDADVQLASFTVDSFPTLRIHGDDLTLRLKKQQQSAPFIEVRHFEVTGDVFGLLHRHRRFSSVVLEGLRITIPPRTPNDREAGGRVATAVEGPVLIDRVVARDAQLILVPADPRKEPKVWSIHDLDLEAVGFNRAMPFKAALTNPIPAGEIQTAGTFGPWMKGDPGQTALEGHYTFDRVKLDTIKGIGGTLTSTGDFSGQLHEIDVRGKTSTPDFTIDVGGAPAPLETEFHAVVDGTNGNTYLKPVKARLLETDIEASGAVESRPGSKGRWIDLDVTIANGRIQDVLRLAMNAPKPPMIGGLALRAALTLPPGQKKVADRLELAGHFALEQAAFTDRDVQEQLANLSRRARGPNAKVPAGPIRSNMRGRFRLRNGVIAFNPFGFGVPGADVEINGTYGLRSQRIDFQGTFLMDASISQAAGGIRGFFLKPFDRLFRDKRTKGARLPITITGSRERPRFGLNWRKVFK